VHFCFHVDFSHVQQLNICCAYTKLLSSPNLVIRWSTLLNKSCLYSLTVGCYPFLSVFVISLSSSLRNRKQGFGFPICTHGTSPSEIPSSIHVILTIIACLVDVFMTIVFSNRSSAETYLAGDCCSLKGKGIGCMHTTDLHEHGKLPCMTTPFKK
jgi:hypothetical protein